MLSEGQTLGYEVVVHEGEGAGGKEIDRYVKVSGVSSAVDKSSVGEAMAGDVGESGGKDGVFGRGEGRGCFMLVRVVITGTCWYSAANGQSKGAKKLR